MTPEELAVKLEQTILTANEALGAGIIKIQDSLYPQLVKVLKDLELDDQGLILQNAGNRAVISKALNVLDQKVASSQYQALVERYLGSIVAIDKITVSYFEVLSDSFKPNRQFLASLQKQTISQLETMLFNEGFQAQIKIPLSSILNKNINSGSSFADMLDEVRTYIKGSASIDGQLLRYTRVVTKDTLADYARAFQKAITSDLGLEWFAYSGGLMDKSREFCIERAGRYFKKSEVESWADLDWAGKRPGTNASSIFIFCGGYSCGHQLIPVDAIVVPREDKKRASELGFN